MPDKRPSVKNERQYEALKDKGMSKERAARIANSPGASSRGGKKSGSGGNSSRGEPPRRRRRPGGKVARPRRGRTRSKASPSIALFLEECTVRSPPGIRLSRRARRSDGVRQ